MGVTEMSTCSSSPGPPVCAFHPKEQSGSPWSTVGGTLQGEPHGELDKGFPSLSHWARRAVTPRPGAVTLGGQARRAGGLKFLSHEEWVSDWLPVSCLWTPNAPLVVSTTVPLFLPQLSYCSTELSMKTQLQCLFVFVNKLQL